MGGGGGISNLVEGMNCLVYADFFCLYYTFWNFGVGLGFAKLEKSSN